MIQVTPLEAEAIKKKLKNNHKMKVASARKKKNGKTYYVLCDDRRAIKILCKLRGISRSALLKSE